ncbi:hypothetical protein Tsubulata_014004, partial [Turnera subulata]
MIMRTIIQVVPPRLKELWSGWQLRMVVLISLIFQIVLIAFGNRRKYIPWVKFVVWSAYLVADYVATLALGVISSNLGDMYDDKGAVDRTGTLKYRVLVRTNQFAEPNYVTMFWTPFPLLHLGGPDTITAYSLEDNELWLRHFLGIVMQAFGTIYTLSSWPGLRTWVLRSASKDQLRESLRVTRSDPGPGNSNLDEEYSLRDAEGYNVIPNRVIELQLPVDTIGFEDNSISKDHELLAAFGLFQIYKGLFVGLILGSRDRDTSQTICGNISVENAFKLIGIECSFVYDLFYTKATSAYNPWGLGLRLISFTLTIIVLVLFSLTAEAKLQNDICNVSTDFLRLGSCLVESAQKSINLASNYYSSSFQKSAPIMKIIVIQEGKYIALQKYGFGELNWTTELEFDQSILIWHIATEMCNNLEDSTEDQVKTKQEISTQLSQYMIGQAFISTEGKVDVHRKLLQHFTTGLELPAERYRSKKSVLSHSCRLANVLTNISNKRLNRTFPDTSTPCSD